MKRKIRVSLTPYLYLMPLTIIMSIVYLYPLVNLVKFSFFKATLGSLGKFVGLENFYEFVSFLPTIYRTLIWTFGAVIPAMLIGLGGALLFQDNFRGKRIILPLSLVPYFIPLVVAAFLWLVSYNPSFGLINLVLLRFGVINKPISFLSYHTALFSVIIVRIWRATPFALLTYYAGLQAIPQQYYEAAEVDGANALQKFFNITIPQLHSVTLVTGIILTVWTALLFDIIFPMTGGGPINATEIIPITIYRVFLDRGQVGRASALGLITTCILIIISLFYWRASQKREG